MFMKIIRGELPFDEHGDQASGCDRENNNLIREYITTKVYDSIPDEDRKRVSRIELTISCGGIAKYNSGCNYDCVPFVSGIIYDHNNRRIGDFMYTGNLLEAQPQ
jgi:hypothetical protein